MNTLPITHAIRALVAVTALCAPTSGWAAFVYVDVANESGTEDGTAAFPFNTIREGIDLATNGDRVLVAEGLYKETILMKDGVSLLGAGRDTTIIDGAGLGNSVVNFNGTRDSPILAGFTITGGSGDQVGDIGGDPIRVGGGVRILDSDAILTNVLITGNHVQDGYTFGAGIYVYSADLTPQIVDSIIAGNAVTSATIPGSGRGGGIYFTGKSGGILLSGNHILDNEAVEGGGIFLEGSAGSTSEIRRNTIGGNSAVHGAGICAGLFDTSSVSIVNNLLQGNGSAEAGAAGGGIHLTVEGTAEFSVIQNTLVANHVGSGSGGALWLDDSLSTGNTLAANNVVAENSAAAGGGIDHTAFSGLITTNAFHNNAGGDLHDAGGSGATVTGNLFADPQFLDPAIGNYQLGPGSPCIDAADDPLAPEEDLGRFLRPFDGDGDLASQSDIGAFEYPAGDVVELQMLPDGESVGWPVLPQQEKYNLYRGSVTRLASTGEHTQDPSVEPMAARFCNTAPVGVPVVDPYTPPTGETVYYLVSLGMGSWEGGLGDSSAGFPRTNPNGCP